MKAIDTKYKGYKFRSRLEARWAVFFDQMGIPWEYEVEGFDLDGLRYLPDFWLPLHEVWVEIKGHLLDDKLTNKMAEQCTRLALGSECPVIVNYKDPMEMRCVVFRADVAEMYRSTWSTCPACGTLGIKVLSEDKRSEMFWCPHNTTHELEYMGLREERRYHRKIYDAAQAARQARFEYGQTPK